MSNAEDTPENIPLLKAMGGSLIINPKTFAPEMTLYAHKRIWTIYLLEDDESIKILSDEDDLILREYFYGEESIHCYFDEGNVFITKANFAILNEKPPRIKVNKKGGGRYA